MWVAWQHQVNLTWRPFLARTATAGQQAPLFLLASPTCNNSHAHAASTHRTSSDTRQPAGCNQAHHADPAPYPKTEHTCYYCTGQLASHTQALLNTGTPHIQHHCQHCATTAQQTPSGCLAARGTRPAQHLVGVVYPHTPHYFTGPRCLPRKGLLLDHCKSEAQGMQASNKHCTQASNKHCTQPSNKHYTQASQSQPPARCSQQPNRGEL